MHLVLQRQRRRPRRSDAQRVLILKQSEGFRDPALIAGDFQRPAAVEQLATLGRQIDVPVYTPPPDEKDVVRSAKASLAWAESQPQNVEIFDTAGRQEIDEPLVEELKRLRDF